MATLFSLALPGISVGQTPECSEIEFEGECLFRDYNFGVSDHNFRIFIWQLNDHCIDHWDEIFPITDCDDGYFAGDQWIPDEGEAVNSVVEVRPFTDEDAADYSDGVTAADISAIYSHINSINIITDPFKVVAADPNEDHDIDTDDIDQITALILSGTLFTRPSWEWFNTYSIANNSTHFNSNPFAYAIRETWPTSEGRIYAPMSYTILTGFQERFLHYRTTKIGELSVTTPNSWVCDSYSFSENQTSVRSNKSNLDQALVGNQEFTINVNVNLMDDIIALELPIFIDSKVVKVLSIENVSGLDLMYHYNLKNNRLTILYVDKMLKKIPGTGLLNLIKVKLKALKNINSLDESVNWDQRRNVEAIDHNDIVIDPNASLEIMDIQEGSSLLQYNQSTKSIEIITKEAIEALISIYDMNGSLILQKPISRESGIKYVDVEFILNSGIYIGKYHSSTENLSLKFYVN